MLWRVTRILTVVGVVGLGLLGGLGMTAASAGTPAAAEVVTSSASSPVTSSPVASTPSSSTRPSSSTAASAALTATHFNGVSTVGVLLGAGKTNPGCTASVVDSPKGDVIVTAAHCLSGTSVGTTFVPGYRNGKEPYGSWTVTAAYGASGWLDSQNTADDFAFLVVAPRTIEGKQVSLQSVTGGNQLGVAPAAGQKVTVPAYGSGADTLPITCTNVVVYDATSPAFDCTPYLDGSSGSPWLISTGHGDVLVGIIGGLNQGGCYPNVSYSAPFGATTTATYLRAAAGAAPSTFPAAGGNGCTTGM